MLQELTSRMNWSEIAMLRGEAMAVASGWAAAREMLKEEVGPAGAKAATRLPMPATRAPSSRVSQLDAPNVQRPVDLTPVSVAYEDYTDKLVMTMTEMLALANAGRLEEKIDECWEALYSRLLIRLGAVFQNAAMTPIVRGYDNGLEPWADNAHVRSGGTEDNLGALGAALTADNVRATQTLLANQQKISGEPGVFMAKFLVSSDWGKNSVITGSDYASSALDKNTGAALTPIHLPGYTNGWALVSRPSQYGINLEYQAGGEPYVLAPRAVEGRMAEIEFGTSFAFIVPSYQGAYFQI